jgi:cytochrome c oxidase subunit II
MTRRERGGSRGRTAALTSAAIVGLGTLLAACSGASNNQPTVHKPAGAQQTTLHPKGPSARTILNLFTPFFWIAVVIGIAVCVATVYVAIRYRRRSDDERPVQTHGNTPLEIGWTIIPALLLIVMAVPTVAVIFSLAKPPTGPDVVHIDVTGHQWWWEYGYKDKDTGFTTANEMHIPVGRPVYLSLRSIDVIHSFWVPNLAGKKDVVPGRTQFLKIEASQPGTWLGQCAEFCGLSHANMRLRVIADTPADYAKWVASQKAPLTASQKAFVSKGLVAKYGCTACHSFTGVAGSDKADVGPNLTHLATRTTFAGGMFDVNSANLHKWVYDAPAMKPMQTSCPPGAAPCTPGQVPGMKPYKGEMTQQDLDRIVTFLLSTKQ